MPGITSWFRASTVRAAVPPIRDATCAIVPSFTATSWAPSIPDAGSMTRPPRTIRSNFAIASLLLRNHTQRGRVDRGRHGLHRFQLDRSEEHTSELQSPDHLICILLHG